MRTIFAILTFFICCCYIQDAVAQEIREKTENQSIIINKIDSVVIIDDPVVIIDDTAVITDDPEIVADDAEDTADDTEDEEEFAEEEEIGNEPDSILFIPESWETNFDNLLNSWHVTHYTNKVNHEGYKENIPASDEVYMERLSKLPNIIELPFNTTVRNCINLYVERRRDLTEYMLGRESLYFPMIEEALDRYDLPLELKYLAVIESALNPIALSKAGASGLWQFMLATGKIYGLEINSLIDERRDPAKATDAACRYLKEAYDLYEDWNLAIASYNCGKGNVNKAIRRAGGKKDFWAIYNYLPRETRTYVPLFIAANYVMNYYPYHQLYPVETSMPAATDTVMITQSIHFDQIAEVLQIDKEMLRVLNPQYKRDIIPGNIEPQVLLLPALQAYAFVEKENEIASYRADELFPNRIQIVAGSSASGNRTERITHKVAGGETVATIAHKYGVTAANVQRWNGLRSNIVAPGKSLVLYVDNGGYTMGGTSSTASAAARAQSNPAASSKINPASVATVQYKVQDGETFYSIAQKFPGYSYADLMKLNNRTSSSLRVGQYIAVPKI